MKFHQLRFTRYMVGFISMLFVFNVCAKTENIDKKFTVSQGGTLTVNSDNGSIEVESWSKSNVEIKVKKKAHTQENLDDFELTFNQTGNNIFVEGNNGWNNRVSIQYLIKVPSNFNVNLDTAAGSITIGDLSGVIKVHTSGGSINIGNITKGNVNADTSGGSINIGNIAKGNVDADTSGGSIIVGDVNGKLTVNTSGGSIRLGNITGTSNIQTSGGSITLESSVSDVEANTSGGGINIGSVKGDLDVDTSGSSIYIAMVEGDITAETSGGSINVDSGKGKIAVDTSGGNIQINSSGGAVVANTSGGGITIRQANGSINANTSGGSIDAEMIAISGDIHVKLSTSGGDLTLYIPENLAASINAMLKISRNAQTDYQIYSDFPLTIKDQNSRRIIGTGDINGGGHKIDLNTSNGDIYIKKLEK